MVPAAYSSPPRTEGAHFPLPPRASLCFLPRVSSSLFAQSASICAILPASLLAGSGSRRFFLLFPGLSFCYSRVAVSIRISSLLLFLLAPVSAVLCVLRVLCVEGCCLFPSPRVSLCLFALKVAPPGVSPANYSSSPITIRLIPFRIASVLKFMSIPSLYPPSRRYVISCAS